MHSNEIVRLAVKREGGLVIASCLGCPMCRPVCSSFSVTSHLETCPFFLGFTEDHDRTPGKLSIICSFKRSVEEDGMIVHEDW